MDPLRTTRCKKLEEDNIQFDINSCKNDNTKHTKKLTKTSWSSKMEHQSRRREHADRSTLHWYYIDKEWNHCMSQNEKWAEERNLSIQEAPALHLIGTNTYNLLSVNVSKLRWIKWYLSHTIMAEKHKILQQQTLHLTSKNK